MKTKVLVVFFILVISLSLSAENSDTALMKGFRASLQNNQFDISIPFIFNSSVELAPSISIVYANEVGTDFGIGLSLRKYNLIGKVAPFYGIRCGVLSYKPKNQDSVNDFIAGLCTGAEYFFEKNLSLGVELQLNGSFSDEFSYRFCNPDEFNINTASTVFVSVYW